MHERLGTFFTVKPVDTTLCSDLPELHFFFVCDVNWCQAGNCPCKWNEHIKSEILYFYLLQDYF